jgi:cysteine desulfurase
MGMTPVDLNIYLDNNATTRPAPEVVRAMLPYLTEVFGNPASPHGFGDPARQAVEEARRQVAALLTAHPAEIVFTGGGTEGNHAAILGALALRPERRGIVTTAVEHPSNLLLFERLERQGYRVTYLPVDAEGELDPDDLERAVDADTALVSLMWVNNETGVIFPVPGAARLAHERGALVHTDAVQVAGKLPFSLASVPVDFLSLSGHKLHGPKGVGALFVRKGLKPPPLLFGHQERGRRGGTLTVPGIVGLGEACRLALAEQAGGAARVATLRDRLEQGVLAAVPLARVTGSRVRRAPHVTNLRFPGLDGEAIQHRLGRAGIAVSTGAACSAGGTDPSHVLTAMGVPKEEALSAIRFSLSRETTAAEVEAATGAVVAVVNELALMHVGG